MRWRCSFGFKVWNIQHFCGKSAIRSWQAVAERGLCLSNSLLKPDLEGDYVKYHTIREGSK